MRPLVLLISCALFFGACSSSTTNTNNEPPVFDFSCDVSAGYASAIQAERYSTSETFVATVIVVHGKNGAPSRSHIQSLATDLNTSGYDVVAPTMPWADLAWNGTLCEGIAHLNELILEEKNAGKSVILLGHSLAGPIALSYVALSNTTDPDAVVVLAPGHVPHQSTTLANAHAVSISKAKDLVSNQNSDVTDFQTYNLGGLVDITSTPEVYLSYHDTEEFPDIEASLPLVDLPILWLAGSDDSLTVVMDGTFGLPGKMPVSQNNVYKVIDGTHFTLVDNVTTELNTWYSGL